MQGQKVLNSVIRTSGERDRIARLLLDYPEIKEIPIQKHHFNQVIENRKTKAYGKAIQIAKMLILNYSPDIRSGQENMLTLLFDMNKLWEEYIYRMLVRANKPE